MKSSILERGRTLLGPGLVVAVGGALALHTHRSWGDPIVDFGREVYLAWQVSRGAVLYRDVAHFNGPLSVHLNAAWFDLVGAGVPQLAILNVLLLGCVTAALMFLCRTVGDRFSATVAAMVFLALHGLAYFGSGTYNFVTPYSHELTHGLLLGLLAVVGTVRFHRTGASRWALITGAAVGLAFFTKPETFAASLVAGCVGMFAAVTDLDRRPPTSDAAPRLGPGGRWRVFALTALGGIIPVVLGILMVARQIGLSAAMDALTRQWRMALDPRIRGLEFYDWVTGFDMVGSNVRSLVLWTGGVAFVLLAAAWASRRIGDRPPLRLSLSVVVTFATLLLAPWIGLHRIWFFLPAAVAAAVAAAAVSLWGRRPITAKAGRRAVAILGLGTLSAVLLAKQAFHPRVSHYGFALAAPAVALTVAILLGRLPNWIGRGGRAFRAQALGMVTGVVFFHLGLSQAALEGSGAPTVRVGEPANSLWTDEVRGPILRRALEYVSASSAATVAVLPEGAYLNFLLGRPNSTPFVQLLPPELISWSEEEVLSGYRRHPPDLVVLVHHGDEYGVGTFGQGHAELLMTWVRDRYRSTALFGGPPFRPETDFGVEVLEWKGGWSHEPRTAGG